MKLKSISLILFLLGLFAACDNDVPELPKTVPAPTLGERTVLAFVLADNSLNGYWEDDFNEMIEGIQSVDTKQNNLIVYMDRMGVEPQLFRICRDTDGKIIQDTIESYSKERNSVGVNEMKEVFQYVFNRFPSNDYGAILWSHGDGWVPYSPKTRWVGQDKNDYTVDFGLNINDLNEVLASVPRLNYLLFDACLMQSVEVAYELRDRADYFIGSPTEIPGIGAPYQTVVPALFAKNQAALDIATAYFTYYQERYNAGVDLTRYNWTAGVSISVLQANKLAELASATRNLSIYEQTNLDRDAIFHYDPLRRKEYFDMDAAMRAIAGSTPAYQEWKRVYDAAFIYRETTPKNLVSDDNRFVMMFNMDQFTGLSTYLLSGITSTQNSYYKTLAWYQDTKMN